MTWVISPLVRPDLPELSRFLTRGFGTSADADFATAEVLSWKYLEPGSLEAADHHAVSLSTGVDLYLPRSFLARDIAGRIIGHLGICRTAFEGQALAACGGHLSTIHIIDWLGSPQYRSVGIGLMRKAHRETITQFGLGVSPSALAVGERAGYTLRSLVPVYTRVVRPSYWLRTGRSGPFRRWARLVLNQTRNWVRPPVQPRRVLTLKRIATFGPEIDPIVQSAKLHVILTRRDSARLNYMLRFPRQAMTGWHIVDEASGLCGIALLNVISKSSEHTNIGKIIDCLLSSVDVALWHATFLALVQELAHQGADVVHAYASTPWADEALQQAGFQSRFNVKFHTRDRKGLIPRSALFHLTPLEGDYAYT
jgi:hypothetical protein